MPWLLVVSSTLSSAKMTLQRFLAAYRSFFFPSPVKPPFLHICQVGDPVLRSPAKIVNPEQISSPEVQQVMIQMQQVMKRYDGVGIAAPQIGIPLRILALEVTPKRERELGAEVYAAREMSSLPLMIFINPKMEVLDFTKVVFPESCESLRGYSALVPRYKAVRLTGLDKRGEPLELESKGWIARIIQHEMDHLDGRLYIDLMDPKSFQNDAWQKINTHQGRVKIQFYEK
ncbi:peptide deformylase, mitochondrial-like isoform X2 [Panulirus ornatus]|uniref:peptide deformylase, mitochondrial-like isoform X2 n=1 Tax=Panulirus ornatus TaxID=150431 RepID=UPI003A8470C0